MATVPIGGLTINNPLALANNVPGQIPPRNNAGFNAGTATAGDTTPQPNPTPQPTPSTGSDPAASAAATAAAQKQAQITAAINYGTSNALAAGTAGTAEAAGNLGQTGENYRTQVATGQNNIDLARTQIGTAQINSIKQLHQTIKNGLQGAGVELGNTGALGSSASDAVARAYAEYGNTQTNAANNTAATGNEAQDVAQQNLDITSAGYKKSLDDARDSAIANIQGTAISALNNLGTLVSVYLGGDPSKINAGAIQNQIISQAQNELSQVDSNYQNMLNGIHPANAEQTAQRAESASNAGVVPAAGAPFSPTPPAGGSTVTTQPGAPAPGLIPLTLGKPQDQTPGS